MSRSNCGRLFFYIVIGLAVYGCGGPLILSQYGSSQGVAGGTRSGFHSGVDFGEKDGAPVIASADGKVVGVHEIPSGCGVTLLLSHKEFGRHTVYCHLKKATVQAGEKVKRGDVIGLVGTTGHSMGVPHVHLELCKKSCWGSSAIMSWHEDPLSISIGCFDQQKNYPTDRLVLTYPVHCKEGENK